MRALIVLAVVAFAQSAVAAASSRSARADVPVGDSADTTDSDRDLLSDAQELELGTDPYDADTDGDGLKDGYEVRTAGTDPLVPDAGQLIDVELCTVAGVGSWVMLPGEGWPREQCGAIYPMGRVYDAVVPGAVPVYRHEGVDGGHRLSLDGASLDGEAEPELAFWALPATGTAATVYGYTMGDAWAFVTGGYTGWREAGLPFDDEVPLFDVEL